MLAAVYTAIQTQNMQKQKQLSFNDLYLILN